MRFALVGMLAMLAACGGETPAPEAPEAPEAPAETEKKPEADAPKGPAPGILMVQAQFVKEGGKPKPGPAKLTLWRSHDGKWSDEIIEDDESNVFHKAMHWRDGILTIGANAAPKSAQLKHWKQVDGKWTAEVLWEKTWSGKFNRLRDIEIGDVNGDGKENLVIATHDKGVVAVGTEVDGKWSFAEMDEVTGEDRTFVHEIEIGDVDGDGKKEFYATPSEPNKASGESQPGAVSRYDFKDGKFERSWVVQWEESHAKEILVADMDGDGTDELYAVREGHVVKENGQKKRVEDVRISQMIPKDGGGFEEKVVATLADDQCRFIFPADANHDGKTDMIAAGMSSGLWMLTPKGDGTFESVLIDPNSGGFEHASHAADLDKDGKVELYVAADKQKQFRKYVWNGSDFDREVIAPIGDLHITWNLQDGVF